MANEQRALETAKKWVGPAALYQMYDCCDSMREAEKLEARFDGLVDDEISIRDYVRQYLRLEYAQACKDAVMEGEGVDISAIEGDRFSSDLLIPFLEVLELCKK